VVELRILGPAELADRDIVTLVTSPATRRLLVRLALAGAGGVDSAALADELELNPGALRTAVSRLRVLVDGRVTMSGSRYVLGDVALDADRFERLVAVSAEGGRPDEDRHAR
jgi:hypothetical protein